MVPAPVPGNIRPRRWACLGLVIAACVGLAGCARLGSFRKPAAPAFGTETASHDGDSTDHPASGDLYADMIGKKKPHADPAAKPGAELARDDRSPEGEAVAIDTPRAAEPAGPTNDPGPAIALQPPVTLPAFSESHDSLANLSNRTAAGFGWKSESKLREEATPPATENEPAATLNPVASAATPVAPAPTLDSLLAQCRQKLDAMTTYQVKMNHQERVGATLNPAEDVVLSIRRSPKAVRIEWQEGTHKGREVLYAADANNGQMHVRMGEALLAAPRISMAPDSPLALKNGRHPITEAGFDTVVARMEDGLKKQKAGDPAGGKFAYAGLKKPDGIDKPCHKITRVMPTGENWVVFLDPDTAVPTFVQETAANGDLLERYVFRDLTPNVAELAKAEAFDPDARWGASSGILQRLARAASSTGDAPKPR